MWTATRRATEQTSSNLETIFAMQNKPNSLTMPAMKNKEKQTPAIQVLERMFSLLDLLASHQDPVSLKNISATTGLHPSTAHRILNDLALGRFVDRPEAGSYRLGMRLLELGNLVKARLDV